MITYRRATVDDLDALVRLRIAFLRETNRNVTSEEAYGGMMAPLRSYFAEHIPDAAFISWIAESGGEIVATSGLSFYSIPPGMTNPSGKVAYVMNMYTVPEFRRRGIAAELFRRVVGEAERLGYRKVELHATAAGAGIYRKQGFKEQTTVAMVKYLRT